MRDTRRHHEAAVSAVPFLLALAPFSLAYIGIRITETLRKGPKS